MPIKVPPVPLKRVRLRNRPQAAAVARRDAVLTARDWGVPEEVIDRLETCVSEIVTNAHRHAARPDAGETSAAPAARPEGEEPPPGAGWPGATRGDRVCPCASQALAERDPLPAVRPAREGDEPSIEMTLHRLGDRLRVEVRDGSHTLPSGCVVEDPYGESGRGLFIVACLTDGHGAHRTPTGKTVWFELVAWPGDPGRPI